MAGLIYPPTQNGLQKQLNADLNTGVTASATLTNTTGLQNKPGVMVVNRIDISGNVLPAAGREYISFTGTSGSTITGLARGLGGSTDQDHSNGEVVEFVFDVVAMQAIIDALANVVDPATGLVDTTKIVTADGTQTLTNKTITSPTINTPTLTSPTITGTIAGEPSIVTPKVITAHDCGTVGATETVNWANGDLQTLTMDENLTITFSNAVAGQRLTLFMLQDGTGTNTITWADTITWQDGATWGTSMYSVAANKMNVVVIYYSGTAYFGMVGKFA